MLVLYFEFGTQKGDYIDPLQIIWTVKDYFTLTVYQTGELQVTTLRTYGSYEQLQQIPVIDDDEISGTSLSNKKCKTMAHLRHIFWHVIKHWKVKDPQLILAPKGGWPIWSHFLHRMVHDDFQNRKDEDLRNVVDLDAMEKFSMLSEK